MSNVAKKKLKLSGSVISPRTSLDNIVASVDESVFGGTTTIVDANGKIKDEHIAGISASKITGVIDKANLPGSVDDIVELVSYSDSAPSSGFTTGAQYYKSGTGTGAKKIYTATGENTWGPTGETPVKSVIYFVPSTNKSYRWSGSDMAEIAASLAVRLQGASTVSVLANSDDFVPSEKAIQKYVDVKLSTDATNGAFINTVDVNSPSQTKAPTAYAVRQAITSAAGIPLVTLDDMSTNDDDVENGSYWYDTANKKIKVKGSSDSGETPSSNVFYYYSNEMYVWDDRNLKMEKLTVEQASATDYGTVKYYYDETGNDLHDVVYDAATVDSKLSDKQDTITVTTSSGLSWSSNTLALNLTAGTGIASITGGTITAALTAVDV